MILIQMCMTIATHGHYFLANHQYEAVGSIVTAVDISMPRMNIAGHQSPHYIVQVDGVNYNIPQACCVEVSKRIPIEKQNHERAFEDEISDKTKDWQQQWKQTTGIEVNNGAGADMDLRDYDRLKDTKNDRNLK